MKKIFIALTVSILISNISYAKEKIKCVSPIPFKYKAYCMSEAKKGNKNSSSKSLNLKDKSINLKNKTLNKLNTDSTLIDAIKRNSKGKFKLNTDSTLIDWIKGKKKNER